MDLFTYLMGKNDKNLLPHSDLFSYLLGKNSVKLQTASGTEISLISKRGILYNLELSKLSTQDGTPTPESPQEVNTVKGYKNLFDKDNLVYLENKAYNNSGQIVDLSNTGITQMYIPVKPSTKYTISGVLNTSDNQRIIFFDTNKAFINRNTTFNNISNSFTFTTGSTTYYIDVQYVLTGTDLTKYQIVEGENYVPYVPYGTNWIYTTITDGTNTRNITLPLNNNEIVGIGNYKDEYIVDKTGHCYLNKKTGKVVLDGSETVAVSNTGTSNWYYVVVKSMDNYIAGIGMSTHYPLVSISNSNTSQGFNLIGSPKSIRIRYGTEDTLDNFKNWLDEHQPEVYYVLAEENLIDLNYNVDLTLYEGANTITNSENADMVIQYY